MALIQGFADGGEDGVDAPLLAGVRCQELCADDGQQRLDVLAGGFGSAETGRGLPRGVAALAYDGESDSGATAASSPASGSGPLTTTSIILSRTAFTVATP